MGWWILAGIGVGIVGLMVGWVIGSIVVLLNDDSTDLWDDEDVYL